MQRPTNFTLNRRHPLAKGLVFAGLGGFQCPGTLKYADSSGFGNHGTLTTMDPATDWVWDTELGRWVLDFDGSNDIIPTSYVGNIITRYSFTLSCWIRPNNTSAFKTWINLGGETIKFRFDPAGSGKASWYSGVASYVANTVLTTGTLYHIALRWEYGGNRNIYLNGAYDGADQSVSGPSINATPLYIGAQYNGSNAFAGQIADSLVHDRALSVPEIQLLASRDPMLGGLIQAPRRRFHAAVDTSKRYWVGV